MRYKNKINKLQMWEGSFQLPFKGRLETSLPCRVAKPFHAFTIVLLALLVGCAQGEVGNDDVPDVPSGTEVPVRFTISARPINAQTRGDGTPMDPISSVELIHDWWIAFINTDTKDIKILMRSEAVDKKTSTSINIDGGFEAETFRTVLPSGNYRVYAFANIPLNTEIFENEENYNKNNGQFNNTYISDFVNAPSFGDNVMQWPSNANIPMTQIVKLTPKDISNTVEEAFNIEVVRAVAKVEFAFTNPSTDEITLKKLEFGRISKSYKISIVPNNSAVGIGPNNKLRTNIKEDDKGILTFQDLNRLVSKPADAPAAFLGSFNFYCKESLGGYFKENGEPVTIDKDTAKAAIKNLFKIDLTVAKNGTDVTKTFFTKKITYINRNDWIKIPITFSSWVINWQLHTYPPIGGYPPVFYQNEDGTNLSATMTTGGEFELYPKSITKDGKTYTVDWSKGVTIDVDDATFFVNNTIPTVKNNKDENNNYIVSPVNSDYVIAGELKPDKTGTVTVTINFYFTENDVSEEQTCSFTITRENGKQ